MGRGRPRGKAAAAGLDRSQILSTRTRNAGKVKQKTFADSSKIIENENEERVTSCHQHGMLEAVAATSNNGAEVTQQCMFV